MNTIFLMKICGIFLIYGPNIYRGCLFEPPQSGGSNNQCFEQKFTFAKENRKITYENPTFPLLLDLTGCSLHGLVNIMGISHDTQKWIGSHMISEPLTDLVVSLVWPTYLRQVKFFMITSGTPTFQPND